MASKIVFLLRQEQNVFSVNIKHIQFYAKILNFQKALDNMPSTKFAFITIWQLRKIEILPKEKVKSTTNNPKYDIPFF